MTLGERIAAKRRAKKWSQGRLAEAIGSKQTTISEWERGNSSPRRKTVIMLAEVLGMSIVELEFGEQAQEEWVDEPVNTEKHTIPLVGDIGAGGHINPVDDHAKGAGLEQVEAPFNAPKGTVAVRVNGDSLYPFPRHGALIYYSRREKNVIDYLHELVICHLVDGRKSIKILTPGTLPGRFTLTSTNALPMLNEEVESVSPIDWIKP
ncbi:MAG: helix-turn-helix domain-containing protein [Robiginitomaculum sp.]|nr:helix-turn-helix domain-containing protein [Robiginitomaculum sp.]